MRFIWRSAVDKLTISIVNYNGGDYLLKCLQSINRVRNEADITTYVIDNDSADDSIEKIKLRLPGVKIIKNDQNLGFGKANNQVLKNLKDEFVLILNPDVYLEKGVLKTVLDYMKNNLDVGGATCAINLPNGQLDLTAHRGFPTPLASLLYFLGDDSKYHLTNQDMTKIHEVDAITGAFFMTRKSVLEKVGFFDEDFFMYGEDIDLCMRIKKKGFKIVYIPTVKILHHKGISSGLKKHSQTSTTANFETRRKSVNYFYQAMKIFYKKHYEKTYPLFINWLIYLSINLKWWLAKKRLVV